MRVTRKSWALALVAALVLPVALAGCGQEVVEEVVERGIQYNLAYSPAESSGPGSSIIGGPTGGGSTTTTADATSTEAVLQAGTDLALDGLREPFDDTSDDATVTVMLYMIGSDLETYDGYASNDIKESLQAGLGDNINVVIETGGSQRWHLSEYLSTVIPHRWVIEGDHLRMLGTGGQRAMTEPAELTEFISWADAAYPADRKILILWDHGGGTVSGYGSDEVYPHSDGLDLAELRQAIAESGVKFNIVGFDACLMGTLETAWALEPVADYLIASEEYEPALGWSYRRFLTELSSNPAIDTRDLAETMVADFISDCEDYGLDELTLSCVDLREIPHVYACLDAYLDNVQAAIEADNAEYATFSRARSSAKEFNNGRIDQVDMVDLVSRTSYDGAEELLAAIDSCVKFRGSSGITGASGLAMYFPYADMRDYEDTTAMLRNLGFTEPLDFYAFFVALMGRSGGESGADSAGETDASGGTGGVGETIIGEGQAAEGPDWAQILELLQSHGTPGQLDELLEGFVYEDTVATDGLDDNGEIPLTETDEGFELQLSSSQWDSVSSVGIMAVLVGDTDRLLLGSDSALSYAASGNPLITTGGSWLGIGGTPVSFESHPTEVRDGLYYYSGSVLARLNGGSLISIELAWPLMDADGNTADGSPDVPTILGYNFEDESSTVGRGYHQLRQGDTVEFLCKNYGSDGSFDDYVTLGSPYTVRSQEAMRFDYIDLFAFADEGDYDIACWGTVVDIYQNTVFTETVWE